MTSPPERPLFAQVGRTSAVRHSRGSRAMLWFIALGLLLSVIALVRDMRLAAQREPAPVEVTDMADEAAAAEADLEARIAAGERPWESPPE